MAVLWDHGVNSGRLTPNEFVRDHLDQRGADLQHVSAQGRGAASAPTPTSWCGTRARRKTISVKTHHQKVDFNVFEGMTVQGVATHTLTRGALAWTDGELRAVRGAGRYLKRPPNGAYFDAIRVANKRKEPHPVER